MKLTKTCETEPAKGAALMLTVSGVQPVHSGAMVHPEQFNAIKITARLLNALSENGARLTVVPVEVDFLAEVLANVEAASSGLPTLVGELAKG